MWMSVLPEELWRRILEIGVVETQNLLDFKDLCCLSITCKRLYRLSNDPSLWSSLLSSDFPQFQCPLSSSSSSNFIINNNNNPSLNSSPKALYKIRFEREKARKLAAHHRAVLRIESQIAEHSRKLQEIQLRSVEETEKMKATGAELSNLRKVRQASVALNVWQPEVVRGRHKQIVEQCVVPADSRIHALEMELRLCKQQITGLDKAYRDEKRRLNAAKEQLASVKYHPLRDYSSTSGRVDECSSICCEFKYISRALCHYKGFMPTFKGRCATSYFGLWPTCFKGFHVTCFKGFYATLFKGFKPL